MAHVKLGRAFTLLDSAASIAILGVLTALAAAGLSGARNADQFTACSNKLANIGAGNGQFVLSHNDRMFGLTWQQGGANSTFPDLIAQQASSQQGAHAAQVIDILRRGGRTDIPVISNWIPDLLYGTLALADFQNLPLSDPFNVCPSHDLLNKWRRWPAAFDQGRFSPQQPSPSAINKRWPYSSSYGITAGAFDINQSLEVTATGGTVVNSRLSQSGNQHNQFTIPGTANIGPSAMSLVALPSQKVHVFDEHQRHLPGVNLYFMYAQSTCPILFFDGSVRVKTSSNARGGWSPTLPSSPAPSSILYAPQPWEPPLANGQYSTQSLLDPYRWTRQGLLGWDFAN